MSLSQLQSHIIVGGGIAGIVAAYILARQGKQVVLAEASNKLGGLLTSKKINGKTYDHGTHLLRETGIPELDKFLLDGLDYVSFPYIKCGTFYNELFDKNGFLAADSTLTQEQRETYLQQLIDATSELQPQTYPNLAEQLMALFGAGYYENVLKDIIQKLFRESPEKLAPNAHHIFGLARIIVANAKKTKSLKENSQLDQILAFHSYKDGISSLKSLYPKNGGAGEWTKLLEEKLTKKGVIIIKNVELAIEAKGNTIATVIINDKPYKTEKLYWTVPPIFLYDKIGLEKPIGLPPKRLTSIVVDLEYKGDYNTDLYYLQNYDPNMQSFRVTLYDNYNPTTYTPEIKRISVEFLSDNTNENDFKKTAEEELVKMNIVDNIDALHVVNVSIIKNSFPIPTPKFREDSQKLAEGLSCIENLVLFGKASGKNWFMNDVIHEVYTTLNKTNETGH